MNISVDVERGCGWRDERGALYLVADCCDVVCGKLPIPLAEVCECCGQLKYTVKVDGKLIKQSRSHRNLMDPAQLINQRQCVVPNNGFHNVCPFRTWPENEPAMLEWIGRQHYLTPYYFMKESDRFGVSRRVRGLPDWFEVGKHWVFLAHLDTILLPDNRAHNEAHPDEEPLPEFLPGIFHAFRPKRVEVIVDDETTAEEMQEYLDKGYTPTCVVRCNEAKELLCTKCNTNVAVYNLDKEDWDEFNLPICKSCWVG
ncbi:MAG TPA: hypothetical protein PKD55_00125 [Bellilinea sp.]|nr:hypothetical protein [Bellilinea sp.]